MLKEMHVNDEKVKIGKTKVKSRLWDAFKKIDDNFNGVNERIEENIILPNFIDLKVENVIAYTAMFASLLNSEESVYIKIHTSEYKTILAFDTAMFNSFEDKKQFIGELLNCKDAIKDDKISDIEVVDRYNDNNIQAPVCIILEENICVLSIEKNYIITDYIKQLGNIFSFACCRVYDFNYLPNVEWLPIHKEYNFKIRSSFVKRVLQQKRKNPSALAIIDDVCGKEVSYSELWDFSSLLMREIKEKVAFNNTYLRIILFLNRGWKHLASILAVQRMGGTCVLVDCSNPDKRIKAFLEETSSDAIICDSNTNDRAEGLLTALVINFDNAINMSNECMDKEEYMETDNGISFIAGTSGTTGKPKAACLSYKGMLCTIDAIINAAKLCEKTRGSWLSSPGYGMIEVDSLPILGAGGTVCIPTVEVMQDARMLADWLNKKEITHSLVMTSIAETLWSGGIDIQLETMLIAGERCKFWPAKELQYNVFNVYGSAEAAVVSIEDFSNPHRTILPSVGQPIEGVNMYVVDSKGRELPTGCIGELIITGETLSIGYINDNDTQKSFKNNNLDNISLKQYLSGDRARINMDGSVEVFGRLDSLVKIRGHRVDLAEIEVKALKVCGVSRAAATCISDDLGTALVLFIEETPNNGNKDIKQDVCRYLKEHLPLASQPNQIFIGKLPLSYNGKVDYKALQKMQILEKDTIETEFVPQTKIEDMVYGCWLTWTRSKEAMLETDFFDCGGDSLRAMRMMGELTHKYGINVKMSSFLAKPSLSNLLKLAVESVTTGLPEFEYLPEAEQIKPFELNESQQSLWIGRGADFNYGGVGCQGYFEWEINDLNQDKFIRAVDLLVKRHPMLRMTINDGGYQCIGSYDGSKAVESCDLSELNMDDVRKEIDLIRERMANDEIGTSKWPLFKFVITKISNNVSRVHFCIDMLIADAWSIFQTIIPDLIDLYINENCDLPQLRTTFFDYLAYRKRVKESERYNEDREYWMNKIHVLPAAPKLPQVEFHEENEIAKFERFEGTLDKESWSALKACAKTYKISPSGVIALALCEVLRFWSEEEEFTLNFPVSDRMPVSDDIDLVVGDFTNTLLVPYVVKVNDTIKEKGKQLQEAIWEALDHRLFTGVEVLRELAKVRRTGREPLMPIVLTSLLGHPGRHDVSKFGGEVYGVSQTPQVTLDVQVRESDGVLYFKWDYLTGVIRPDVLKAMFETFCLFLKQLAENEGIWNKSWLDLRPKYQIEKRIEVNNTAKKVVDVHLNQLLLERVTKNSENIAVIDQFRSYTWKEIGYAAQFIKDEIMKYNHYKDKFIGIILPKGLLQYVAVYGCLLAAKGYVPIDIELPIERVKTITAQSNIHVIITQQEVTVPNGIEKIEVCTAKTDSWIIEKRKPTIEIVPEDYSPYIIFTSGSTGEPKGVEIPEIAVINHIYDVVERMNLDTTTRHLATAVLHFDMSVFDIFGPLLHGGSVVIPEQAVGPIPEKWLELHIKYNVTFWACVPAIMELVCYIAENQVLGETVNSVKNIVMAGDWIPLSLLPRARELFPNANLFSCGGPTETTNWSIIHKINEDEGTLCNSVLYGVPMRNSKYHIVSNNWIERPDWVPGEMLVESEVSLAKGYIGQPKLTEKAFIKHPRTGCRMYRTGDLGRYLPNGEIEILGRIDNQIKINGLRIELGEIENLAARCPGVLRSCAFTLKDVDGRPKQIALAIIGEEKIDALAIKDILCSKLPNYMIPKIIQQVAKFPLSQNGKIDIKVLRKMFLKSSSEAKGINSKKESVRKVLQVFSNQLNQQIVLLEDNFFDLGGDSLTAMKIKIELEKIFSQSIKLESVMLSDNINSLVNEIMERI